MIFNGDFTSVIGAALSVFNARGVDKVLFNGYAARIGVLKVPLIGDPGPIVVFDGDLE